LYNTKKQRDKARQFENRLKAVVQGDEPPALELLENGPRVRADPTELCG
jgi:hypothetical protein